MADCWIVKFYPYGIDKHRITLKGFYDGAHDLPPELSMVPLSFQEESGESAELTLWAVFVGIAQNDTTFALRPEIGWFITK